ncbi:CDP-diacylglycerol--glycerol-3-phosphate 3-phosphatidyltransferase, mitochondrial [Takifugu flavidus]|uniref:CDP-diacylglycerol--glycerol-3-phosphate 3-phosphatidyltransferase n=1 Tax=Takifugu flavidus TaxID=433684 RepID=A0A5C6PTF7_9TELE|nr:CDP-diacylglycerol--glycerol-3-phosphate 3-phosphatidyltransferase, mitochondrial [Takifugu flavidus]
MEEALQRSQDNQHPPQLKVSVLLDYTRGSRGATNSRTMLLPLLQRFPPQVRVSLYHTPDLRGLLRRLVPQRFNETIGVQHIKVYLFDDSVIISGRTATSAGGLPLLADFFSELVDAVGDVSSSCSPTTLWPCTRACAPPIKALLLLPPPSCSSDALRAQNIPTQSSGRPGSAVPTYRLLSGNRRPAAVSRGGAEADHGGAGRRPRRQRDGEGEELSEGEEDTWVFPLVQMKPLGIQVDEEVTQCLLTDAGPDSTLFLTSGYFNLTRAYMQLVLGAGANYRILTASPEVNGFFGAKGVAGAIPAAYIHIARQFYQQVCRLGQQERVPCTSTTGPAGPSTPKVRLRRSDSPKRAAWLRPSAPGLWYYLGGRDRPCLTLIGSPNFGHRSVHRDLEAQIAMVTQNQELQGAQLEQQRLYRRSTEVSSATFEQPDRHVQLWVKLVTPFIKNFF